MENNSILFNFTDHYQINYCIWTVSSTEVWGLWGGDAQLLLDTDPSPWMQTPWMQTSLDVLPVLKRQSPLHADLLGSRTAFLGIPKNVDALDTDPSPLWMQTPWQTPDADPPRCRSCPPPHTHMHTPTPHADRLPMQTAPIVDRQTPVKTLPCPKLSFRAVMKRVQIRSKYAGLSRVQKHLRDTSGFITLSKDLHEISLQLLQTICPVLILNIFIFCWLWTICYFKIIIAFQIMRHPAYCLTTWFLRF